MIGFDIETHAVTPEGEDVLSHLPLGITCAAASVEGGEKKLFYPGWTENIPAGELEGPMKPYEINEMVDWMLDKKMLIATWNGLGFDWRVIATEVPDRDDIKEIALNHIDPMFELVCRYGYGIKLENAAKVMIGREKVGMHGDQAPIEWRKGVEERKKVIEYVGGDADLTLDLVMEISRVGGVKWITKTNKLLEKQLALLTCKEALELPEPDTRWMTSNTFTREKFYEWTQS